MEQAASWIAPIATTIAAIVAASNLGARITGWGFVIFTVGSVAWTAVGYTTGQANLIWQNLFLTVVNLFGIWRWLGREARWGDGAARAAERSEGGATTALFPAHLLSGGRVLDRGGATIGSSVDAMLECDSGRIAYVVVRAGGVAGVGETLHALPWERLRVEDEAIVSELDGAALSRLPEVDPERWPSRAPA